MSLGIHGISQDWEMVAAPKELSNDKLLNNPRFQKLVQFCSVWDAAIIQQIPLSLPKNVTRSLRPKINYKTVVTPNPILRQVQALFSAKLYSGSQLALCKKIHKHLNLEWQGIGQISHPYNNKSNQTIANAIVQFIQPLMEEIPTILSHRDDFEKCFPNIETRRIQKGEKGVLLRSLVEKGHLIIGQALLVNDDWETLTEDLANNELVVKQSLLSDKEWELFSTNQVNEDVKRVNEALKQELEEGPALCRCNSFDSVDEMPDRFPHVDSQGSVDMDYVNDDDADAILGSRSESDRSISRSSVDSLDSYSLEAFLNE